MNTANVITDELVELPAGEFLMGSDNHYPEEKPAHRVRVDAFRIAANPVTNAQFAQFVRATGYQTVAERPLDAQKYPNAPAANLAPGSMVFTGTSGPVDLRHLSQWWAWIPGAQWRKPFGPGSSLAGRMDHPVVHVAHEDAAAYAKWVGSRLPTEAEWEYACRGGLSGAEFSWGDSHDGEGRALANYWRGEFPYRAKPGFGSTSPVGSFPANGYGLWDMCGNVWEWTDDWYSGHEGSGCCVPHNPRGAREDQSVDPGQSFGMPRKVVKGGSFLCADSYCKRYRPSARRPQEIDTGMSHIGFRIAADLQTTSFKEQDTMEQTTREDILPSWRDSAARRSIIEFVERVTTHGADYVPQEKRIAVFDNDGTLCSEKPLQVQLHFYMEQWRKLAEENPDLVANEPYRAASANDFQWFNQLLVDHYAGDDRALHLVAGELLKVLSDATLPVRFAAFKEFYESVHHPVTDRLYPRMGYVPMRELLDYLALHGFTNFIVSGGGRDFIREVSQTMYGLGPERVIGSAIKLAYDESLNEIRSTDGLDYMDDGAEKVVQIFARVGQRPILAVGNANGDLPMLRYALGSPVGLGLLINHDDDTRRGDAPYGEGAEIALAQAESMGLQVVSVRDDWDRIYD